MGIEHFNKLVRDNIPEIINSAGDTAVIEFLDDDQYFKMLNDKLAEEVNEYNNGYNLDELPDILEVIYSIADFKGIGIDELEKMRNKKLKERGGFAKRINLIEVIRS